MQIPARGASVNGQRRGDGLGRDSPMRGVREFGCVAFYPQTDGDGIIFSSYRAEFFPPIWRSFRFGRCLSRGRRRF